MGALKLAEDFENTVIENKSNLYKDRLAKSLFNDDLITYNEAKYFSNYENADLWISQYSKIRGMLKRKRNDAGEIIEFQKKSNWIKVAFALLAYFVFTSIGLIPFYKFYKYVDWIVVFYEKGMFLSILIIVALHGICLLIGFLSLKYVEKSADCGIFLNDFKEYAFRL